MVRNDFLVQIYSGLKFVDAAKNNVKTVKNKLYIILWASWRSYL